MRPKIQIGLLVLATLMASNIAFAKKFPLTADASVPAARGQVDVGKDKNGNTEVEVEVKYLAPPENHPAEVVLYSLVSGTRRRANRTGPIADE
jgi:hypothetical protein